MNKFIVIGVDFCYFSEWLLVFGIGFRMNKDDIINFVVRINIVLFLMFLL